MNHNTCTAVYSKGEKKLGSQLLSSKLADLVPCADGLRAIRFEALQLLAVRDGRHDPLRPPAGPGLPVGSVIAMPSRRFLVSRHNGCRCARRRAHICASWLLRPCVLSSTCLRCPLAQLAFFSWLLPPAAADGGRGHMPQQMANDGKEMPTYVIGRGYRAIFHLALVSSRYLRAASLFA